MTLLGQIAGFIVVALLLGFAVGWMTWRAGRRCVPQAEWTKLEQQRLHATQRLAEADGELRLRLDDLEASRRENVAARQHVETLRAERDQLEARLALAEREAMNARLERDDAVTRAGALQRRLAELSVARARTSGMPISSYPRLDTVVEFPDRSQRSPRSIEPGPDEDGPTVDLAIDRTG